MRKEAAKRGHREFFRLLYYLMDPVQLKSIPPRTDTIWVHGWLFKGVSRKSRRTMRAIIDAPGARPLLLAPISPPASSPRHLASIHGILIPIVVAVAEGKPSYSRTCTPSSSSFGFGAWGKLSCLPGPLRPPCHLAGRSTMFRNQVRISLRPRSGSNPPPTPLTTSIRASVTEFYRETCPISGHASQWSECLVECRG